MTEEQALIRNVVDHPEELLFRAVYADWLIEHGRVDEAEFVRHASMTGAEFRAGTVAQDGGDEDYSADGWVAVKVHRGGRAYGLLTTFGHCSCYDTWASINDGSINDYFPDDRVMTPSFWWLGPWEELVAQAAILAGTTGDRQLDSVYRQIVEAAKP